MRISDWSSDVCSSDLLREIFLGNLRFEQIQAHTGATPQILTVRLKRLEANGMVERRLYRERPPRHESRPTAKGEAFHAVLPTLRAWGEAWCKAPGAERAVEYLHCALAGLARSEERRVGTGGVRTGSARWSPDPQT